MKRYLICFAGIDGSGKTTISNFILKSNLKPFKYVWARWEPFFLKPFIKFLNKKSRTKSPVTNDDLIYQTKKNLKKKILHFRFIKSCWLFLAEMDYFFQLIFKVLIPYLCNKYLIADRYIYDFYIDQLINLGEKPSQINTFLSNSFLKIFPKPTVLVYITIKPETGFKRKNDGTSVSYLTERKEFYDELKSIYYTFEVNGEQPIKNVVEQILFYLQQEIKNYE